MSTVQEIVECLKAHLPGIHLRTFERNRGIRAIREACSAFTNGSTKTLWCWSFAAGIREIDISTGKETDVLPEPLGSAFDEACKSFLGSNSNVVMVFEDPYDELERSNWVSWFKRCLNHCRQTGKTIVVLGREINYKPEIQDQITLITYELPTGKELEETVTNLAKIYVDTLKDKVKIDMEAIPDFARALTGLTLDEAKSVANLAIVRYKAIDERAVKMAILEKKQLVERSGILSFEEPNYALKDVGGLQYLKEWLRKRSSLFTQEARDIGINTPKGTVITGIAGTGKTMCARAVAMEWKVPLVRLDMGRLMNSSLGGSEENLRIALKTAEAVAPSILFVDEADKAMASGSGDTDGGTSRRMLGTFLTWMQDKKSDVFVVLTANDISKLPPEFLRKGRFDELFFVDLPDYESRREILNIHLTKKKHAVKSVEAAAAASRGFTGAELESCVQVALINAKYQKRVCNDDDLLYAVQKTVPLSKTMEAQIKALRDWAKSGRAVMAGKSPDDDQNNNREAQVTL